MIGRRFVLFELLGFKVQVDLSWLFLALLVTWSLAIGAFPFWYEGLSTSTYWWMAIAGMIGLVFSLIFHEMSHSLVARQFGLPIRGITLFIFGGVAEMEEEPSSAREEFFVAVVGPIASLVLALGFYVLGRIGAAQGLPTPVLGVVEYLAFINLLLAAFNMVPAFPLDGGRVLRAVLWHVKGSLRQATRLASRSGEIFAMVLMALGALQVVLAGNFVGGMWFFLIGLFLHAAARSAYFQVLTRREFEGEPVSRFMTREVVTVAPDVTVRDFVEDYIYRHHHDLFPVVEGERLVGCVGIRQVKGLAREEWARRRVEDLMVRCAPENTIPADTDAVKAMSVMRQTGSSRLLVTEGERLVGIIVLKDMLDFFALKMDLEGQG